MLIDHLRLLKVVEERRHSHMSMSSTPSAIEVSNLRSDHHGWNNSSSDMQIQSDVDKLSRLIENRRMLSLKMPRAELQNIEIQVWVDPRNPKDSALLARVHPGLATITGFICLALLIGVIKPFVVSKNSLV